MNRREFMQRVGVIPALAFSAPSDDRSGQESAHRGWRIFELTTHVEVLRPTGATLVWVPMALVGGDRSFQRTIRETVVCKGGSAKGFVTKSEGLGIMTAKFPSGARPIVTITSRVATRNRAVHRAAPGGNRVVNSSELRRFVQPTKLVPTDGIVKQQAIEITKSAGGDEGKARSIYEWIVENTYRNPKTRGCGTGDIKFMLESGDLGGKCADLNALYVGLARAVGLPARDVYGIRVAKSELGYKSLGPSSGKVTKAQHCRAEVYLTDYGWVPVDPADVRKVMLEEEPGNRPLDDERVKAARERLFGSWEMNWMAYNFAQDVTLPGSSGPPLRFLMYPQAETALGRIDSLDPDSFRYEINAEEIRPQDRTDNQSLPPLPVQLLQQN